MKRRGLLLGTGAVVATAAGVGAGLLARRHGGADAAAAADSAASAAAGPTAPVDPWSLSFSAPDGTTVAMRTLRGRPLLLNFWATWCGPCATEMPLLDRFATSLPARGWNVLALAVDDIKPVRSFIAERALHLPVALAGLEGLDLSRQLGNTLGALPYTTVFDRTGKLVDRRLGVLDEALLGRWLATIR